MHGVPTSQPPLQTALTKDHIGLDAADKGIGFLVFRRVVFGLFPHPHQVAAEYLLDVGF